MEQMEVPVGSQITYKLLANPDPGILTQAVMNLIVEGWSPLGGIAVAGHINEKLLGPQPLVFVQAMIHIAPPGPRRLDEEPKKEDN